MLNEIFKAYDVRGIYGETITEDIVKKIGKAFVTFLKCKDLVIGYDMRVSSPSLSKAFIEGANELGADVVEIGNVSTDALYFASGFLNLPGVMLTASHNPKEYNGMKFCMKKAVPINYDTGLKKIKEIIASGKFEMVEDEEGSVEQKDILEDFAKHVRKFIDTSSLSKLKIGADAGNGMGGKIVPAVYDSLPIEIIPLFFELDGTFPNHPADPSKFDNLKKLQKTVLSERCDFGMAFDGDADRIFFIDEKGEVCNSSLISSLIIKNLLGKNPGSNVIHNLVCSKIV
ncbi:phosphomannomutase/phosphoglucomutase, partial [Candidatus Woesearchaeota archaeon]|nr:phosphomannomutase/phosphoglucomutase [Candidatus Woesearchaeota archaeon]